MTEIRHLSFDELTTQQLYDILVLRQRVFMIEQQRYYLDCDGLDQIALHFAAYEGEKTLRLFARVTA